MITPDDGSTSDLPAARRRPGPLALAATAALLVWLAAVYLVAVLLFDNWLGFFVVLAATVPFFIWDIGKEVRRRTQQR